MVKSPPPGPRSLGFEPLEDRRLLAAVAGDYNRDGVVDAADYTVWRDTLGSTTDLRANGDDTGASLGVIDQAARGLAFRGVTIQGLAGDDSINVSDLVIANSPGAITSPRSTPRWSGGTATEITTPCSPTSAHPASLAMKIFSTTRRSTN